MSNLGAERSTIEIRVSSDSPIVPGGRREWVAIVQRPIPYLPGDTLEGFVISGYQRTVDNVLNRLEDPSRVKGSSPSPNYEPIVASRQRSSHFRRRGRFHRKAA